MFKYLLLFLSFTGFIYSECRCRCCVSCRTDYVKELLKKLNIDLEKYDGNKYLAIYENYDKFLSIIKKLSGSQKWRMVIDGKDHSKGKYVYEKKNGDYEEGEPGYLEAMIDAWDYMISTLDQEIKISKNKSDDKNDIFLILHQKTTNNVRNMLKESDYYRDKDYNVYFGLGYSSKSGIADKLSEYSNKLKSKGFDSERLSNWYVDVNKNRVECCDYSKIEETEDYKRSGYSSGSRYLASKIFKDYYEKLKELREKGYISESFIDRRASYEDKVLEIIVRTTCLLLWSHIFPDGNGRTIMYLLLNKFLIENKLLPVIFFESAHEVVIRDVHFGIREIKDGQNNFCRMILKGKI